MASSDMKGAAAFTQELEQRRVPYTRWEVYL